MRVDDGEWYDDPPPEPPFMALETVGWASVIDSSGRVMLPECRSSSYAKKMAQIMNDNADGLVAAWKAGAALAKKACGAGKESQK